MMSVRLRLSLFILILCLGTGLALVMGETTGLALADLSHARVSVITKQSETGALYATLIGENSAVYYSDDNGRSWQRNSTGPGEEINALVVHPTHGDILYAGTINYTGADNSLWYSSNGGETWREFNLDLPSAVKSEGLSISMLALDPDDSTALYVGTDGTGLYYVDTETGRAEAVGDASTRDLYVNDVAFGIADRLYVAATEGLFLIEGNATRKIETIPSTAISLAIDPADPQTLYAGTVAYGLYASYDGGQRWQALDSGFGWEPGLILQVPAIAIDEDKPQHLAVTTAYGVGSRVVGGGVYESFNAGENWVKIAEEPEVVEQLVIKGGGIYAVAADGLTRYGNPLPDASLTSLVNFNSLANPTGVQILILGLTIALAGWVLLGKSTWIPNTV